MKINQNNVHLKIPDHNHAGRMAELANNKKIWNNIRNGMPSPFYQSDAIAFIDRIQKMDVPSVFGIFCDNVFVGVIGLHPQNDVYEGSAELGYWIGEPFWGHGLATEAVRQVIGFGFEEMNLRRIFASCYDYNEASKKILIKNGFNFEGIARKAVVKNGVIYDEWKYGILA